MKWIKASEQPPLDWTTAIVRAQPDGKQRHNVRMLSSFEIVLPVRKNAKNLKVSYFGSGKPFDIPMEYIEWLDTASGDGLTYDTLTENEKTRMLTIFHRVKQLSTHINDDMRIKEFMLFVESHGFEIHRK